MVAGPALHYEPINRLALWPGQNGAVFIAGTSNRAFYLVDEREQMVSGKQFGTLATVAPAHDPALETLRGPRTRSSTARPNIVNDEMTRSGARPSDRHSGLCPR